jgi:hypothetical protein
MYRTLRAAKFLFVGPLVLALLLIINLMTSPGHWWIKWPAFGLGIAWFISLVRVLRALILIGGIAAVFAWWRGKSQQPKL